MRAEKFIAELMEKMNDFSKEDKEQIREYFEEMIYDRIENGETEEDILKSFGTPDVVVAKLKSEYKESRVEGKNQEWREQFQEEDRTRKSENKEGTVNRIHTIFVHTENVRIIPVVDRVEKPFIEFDPTEGRDILEISEQNGCFKVIHHQKKIYLFLLFGYEKRRNLILHIPKEFRGNLELESGNVPIELENITSLESLRAQTSNAGINLKNVSAVSMEIQTSNASVKLENVAGECLNANTSNGKIEAKHINVKERTKLRTSNAKVVVEEIESRQIELHTSNGTVQGMLSGSIADYNVRSFTSNASSTLPSHMNTGKDKSLEVKTTNGKINILFEKDR